MITYAEKFDDEDFEAKWVSLAAAARNVTAYLLLRRAGTGSEAVHVETSEPASATEGQATEDE